MFSCEYCGIFKNIYYEKHLRTAAPQGRKYTHYGMKIYRNDCVKEKRNGIES